MQDVKADILFLGCPILGGNIPEQVTRFVAQLDANKVKKFYFLLTVLEQINLLMLKHSLKKRE